MNLKLYVNLCLFLFVPLFLSAQEKVVPVKYGDMEQWVTRKIHESGIIGVIYLI